MAYRFVRWIFTAGLSLFYRWHLLEGAIPAQGPLVIVGNHPNALIDPVAVMRLTGRPVRFLAKAPIFKMPVLGGLVRLMRCLPVYRKQDDPSQMGKNDDTFKAAHQALAAGEAICIFPEGRSHSDPALSPLKTGAARIALGAEREKGFGLGVRFVPVGFVYRQKGIFRSEVAVAVGPPIPVADLDGAHAADPVAAGHQLTERIDAALHQVTLNLDTWDDLPLVEAASRLYRAERGTGADLRPFAQGLGALRARDPDQLQRIRRRVLVLDGTLRALRLPADDLDRVRPLRAVRFAGVHLARGVLGGVPALLGILAYGVPYQLIRAVAHFTAREADVTASVKLGVGVLLMPAWTLGLLVAGWRLGGAAGLVVALVLPACGLFALSFLESMSAALANARAFLALRAHGGLRQRLLTRRKAVVEALEQLGQDVGVLGEAAAPNPAQLA